MVYRQDHSVSLIDPKRGIIEGVATSFYGDNIQALREAQEHGSVYTMPQLIQLLSLPHPDLLLLKIPITVLSEEIVGKSKDEKPVAITVHGAGLLTPELIRERKINLTKNASGKEQYAIPFEPEEVYALLEGKLPSGDIEVYSFTDIKKGMNFPTRYALVRNLDLSREKKSGEHYSFSEMIDDPRTICSAGSVEAAEAHLAMLTQTHAMLANFHPLHDLNLDQPQGRFLERRGVVQGLYGCMEMDGIARFLSVKKNLEEKFENK